MSAQPTVESTPIVPFWNRLREITRYPAHMSAMVTIIMLAFANLTIFLPFGWILNCSSRWRYIATHSNVCALPRTDTWTPPEISQSTDSSLGWKQIWLMVIFFVVAVFGVVLFGRKSVDVDVFLGICLPGATMTLAMDESLASALNPGKWISIFTRIGWPYLAVVGLCLVVLMSQNYAAGLAAKALPLFVALIVVGIIANYALVVTFHLMGYLIYQYHDAVGFVPAAPQVARPLAKPDPDQELLDEVGALVRDGKPESATDLLRGHLRCAAVRLPCIPNTANCCAWPATKTNCCVTVASTSTS